MREKLERKRCVGEGGSRKLLKQFMMMMMTTMKRNVCSIITKKEKCTIMTMIIIACEKY